MTLGTDTVITFAPKVYIITKKYEKENVFCEVNNRLIKRNQDLAEKVAKLQNHLKTVSSQSGESHYFG